MSIYCSVLAFDAEDADDGDGEFHEPPYVYQGSHVEPKATHPHGGYFHVALIPPHIGGEWADFLRVSLDGGGPPHADTVLLHRRHVEELHAFLGEWLRRELPIMKEEP